MKTNKEQWKEASLKVHLAYQNEFKTWKIVNTFDCNEYWGGFTTRFNARMYAIEELNAKVEE